MSLVRTARCCALLLSGGAGFLGTGCGGGVSVDSPSRLELEEVWSAPFPPGFIVRGATGDSSRVIFWADSLDYVMEWTLDNGLRPLQAPTSHRWLAAAPLGESLVFLDRAAIRGGLGEELADSSAPLALEDVDIVGGRWFLAMRDTGGVTLLAPVADSGWRPVFSYRTPMGPHRPRREGLIVTSDGSSMVASSRYFPFTNYGITPDGEITSVFAPIPAAERADGSGGLPRKMRMISTGTFAVGEGFVQVLSDPFALERLIITYDASGRLMRTTSLQVPFGFVAAVPKHGVLLAVRRLENTELAAYRWTWH